MTQDVSSATRAVPVAAVVEAVAAEAGLGRAELLGPSRRREVAHARQVAMMLAVELGPRSQWAVARHFGFGRSTVRRGMESLARRIEAGSAAEARLVEAARARAREIAARRKREATRLAAALSEEAAAGAARPASAARGSASPAKRVSAPAGMAR